jgi:NifU-like protein involved in Fe-S cluster formation
VDFAKFQRLVEARPGFHSMDDATATGEYFSDSCGDMYNIFLKVGPGAIIEDISYFTTGCGFGTATCSLVVELAKGKTIDEASAITAGDVETQLSGYPEKKKDYPERVLETLKLAIQDYREKVAAGKVADYGAMPAPERKPEPVAQTAEPPAQDDGKLLIRLR